MSMFMDTRVYVWYTLVDENSAHVARVFSQEWL